MALNQHTNKSLKGVFFKCGAECRNRPVTKMLHSESQEVGSLPGGPQLRYEGAGMTNTTSVSVAKLLCRENSGSGLEKVSSMSSEYFSSL